MLSLIKFTIMTEEDLKRGIDERWKHHGGHRGHGRLWTGLLLLIVGGLLLLETTGAVLFPAWFFTWPMILIAAGLISGLRCGFRGRFWIIMLLMGGLFLSNEINHHWNLEKYIGPIAIIAFGLLFITNPKKRRWRRMDRYGDERGQGMSGETYNKSTYQSGEMNADGRDFLDVTAVFGGVKKNVLSKNFRGGDIVSFMGGSEIDLSQADFSGQVKIDLTNVFGGTKLIVPPTWDVHQEITAIFGGVDDKRQLTGVAIDPNKVVVLDGTCVFGGIEIRSF